MPIITASATAVSSGQPSTSMRLISHSVPARLPLAQKMKVGWLLVSFTAVK